MKKAIFLAMAMALTLGAFQSSWAAPRTSATLATTTNLTDNISNPDSGVPIGTVINWPYEWMPKDAENWRECNGKSIAGTELCKTTGQCVAPNYQGVFLRGYGGKSGNLGELQSDAVHLPKDAGAQVHFNNIARGNALFSYTTSSYQQTGSDCSGDAEGAPCRAVYENVTTTHTSSGSFIPTPDGKIKGNFLGLDDNGMNIDFYINHPAQETRPINKAVRYLIKVN